MNKKNATKRKRRAAVGCTDGLAAIVAKWEHLAERWKITAHSLDGDGAERLAGHYTGAANTALLCARELRAALAANEKGQR